MKKAFIVSLAIALLQLIAAVILIQYLPAEVPNHWGIDGSIDGYGSSAILFLPGGISLFLALLIVALPKIDPKGENIKKSSKAFVAIMLFIEALMLVLFVITVVAGFGYSVPADKILIVLVGIMLIVMGNYMPKIKPNYTVGIRLPWTLMNEDVWIKTHRFGGWAFVIEGIVILISIFLPPPINYISFIVVVLGGLLITTVYSFMIYKKNTK